jgi:hypothetical protein
VQPLVEVGERPFAALALQRRGIGVAGVAGFLAADDAVEQRADLVALARIKIVAGDADLVGERFAGRGVGLRQKHGDRRQGGGGGSGRRGGGLGAFDFQNALLEEMRVGEVVGDDAERHEGDPGGQYG